jgi:hypothetical protein
MAKCKICEVFYLRLVLTFFLNIVALGRALLARVTQKHRQTLFLNIYIPLSRKGGVSPPAVLKNTDRPNFSVFTNHYLVEARLARPWLSPHPRRIYPRNTPVCGGCYNLADFF